MSPETKAGRGVLLTGLACGLSIFLVGCVMAHTGRLMPGTTVALVGLWVLVCTPVAALIAATSKKKSELRRAIVTVAVLAASLFLGSKR